MLDWKQCVRLTLGVWTLELMTESERDILSNYVCFVCFQVPNLSLSLKVQTIHCVLVTDRLKHHFIQQCLHAYIYY